MSNLNVVDISTTVTKNLIDLFFGLFINSGFVGHLQTLHHYKLSDIIKAYDTFNHPSREKALKIIPVNEYNVNILSFFAAVKA